jgi:hypothetical protein
MATVQDVSLPPRSQHQQQQQDDSEPIEVNIDSSVALHARNEMRVFVNHDGSPEAKPTQEALAALGSAGTDTRSKLTKIFNRVALGSKMTVTP